MHSALQSQIKPYSSIPIYLSIVIFADMYSSFSVCFKQNRIFKISKVRLLEVKLLQVKDSYYLQEQASCQPLVRPNKQNKCMWIPS